ncbi:MAG: class I SAM-dependent methyltransferase [Saprospiraceae bacterium]|nr:class I SAM-dependent methyltransferase [Saprospiraceae bacterium]
MKGQNFHYKDGAENQLLNIFKSDQFNKNSTWFDYRDTWNMFYHLTPERKNLLNWGIFDGENNLNVLELGSGCGAITTALSEIEAISSITCVEGEKSRYEVSKLRHAKLSDKIKFVNANIADFKPDKLFDIVAVIGVLEYSGKYIDDETPYEEFLNIVKRFLKPSGKLVLAIENQLGHKYLAGAVEDHYQKPYIGISDYACYEGIRTFTKNELTQKLKKVGFNYQKFYYPFPDYKMPKVILSEDCFKNEDFDWLTLLDFPTEQYVQKPFYNFDERAFLNLIKDNTDPGIFMNSFLIVTSANEISRKKPTLLAAKMNVLRANEFKTIKSFVSTEQNNIEVIEENLSTGKKTSSNYIKKADNLGILLVDAILSEDIPKIKEYMKIWDSYLNARSVDVTSNSIGITNVWAKYTSLKLSSFYKNATCFLSNDSLDLIPYNILNTHDKGYVIDLEWKLNVDLLPKELILDRGMFWIINRAIRISGRKGSAITNGKWNVPKSIQKIIPLYDQRSLEIFEEWFQHYVCIGEIPAYKSIDSIIRKHRNPKNRFKNWFKSLLKKQLERLRRSKKIVRIAKKISD